VTNATSKKPASLGIKCTSAACDDNLHCFKRARGTKAKPAQPAGSCRYCGATLVDWDRVHACNPADVDHTFEQLRHEFIRHHFWHEPIDETATNHARRKGRIALHDAARRRIAVSVGPARSDNPRDGRQTPFSGNSLYYAQHATATCCRACIEYWHAIRPDAALTEPQIDYLTGLVIRFVDERLPMLDDLPEHVRRRRRG
jgi:hypothetical protein